MKGDQTIALALIILAASVLITSFSGSINNAEGYEGNDTVNISVNISEVSMVDINPAALSYGPLDPGSVGDNDTEAHGFEGIWIENIGSNNVTSIWFNSTYPSQRPFGSGDSAAYDAGNFVVISDTLNGNYTFPSRVEYPREDNDSLWITDLPPTVNLMSGDIFGRFRNASSEYFWVVDRGSGGNCSDGTFYYSDEPAIPAINQPGDTDLSVGPTLELTPTTDPPGWGAGKAIFPNSTGGVEYCVAVKADCSMVMFSALNADAPGIKDGYCESLGYLINSTEDALVPGGIKKAYAKVYVPNGIPVGNVTDGTLTIYVSN